MLAAAPFDWQLSDTYFVVAHFHYVLVGGTLFAIFAGYLLLVSRRSTGRMLERDARQAGSSGCFVIGFHLTFDAMHIPGMLGMPRRIYTYDAGRGWELWNLIVTLGAFVPGASAILIFVCNLVVLATARARRPGNDPWDAWTLEWATTSPPPAYNFATHAGRAQPPAAVGPEASRRSGLEVRVTR